MLGYFGDRQRYGRSTGDREAMALLGACMGEVEEVTVLINDLKHALARSMGGGEGVSWSYWILGEGICGAYRTALFFYSALVQKRGT